MGQETPARQGPSAHRPTAHQPRAFAVLRIAQGNARPAARERARESPRASPWEAVPRARAQPTLLAEGVATTRPTVATSRRWQPNAWHRVARARRTSLPRPAPETVVLALVPTLPRSRVLMAVATEHVPHALASVATSAGGPAMDAGAPARAAAARDRPAMPELAAHLLLSRPLVALAIAVTRPMGMDAATR
jgi:hypothetical protein